MFYNYLRLYKINLIRQIKMWDQGNLPFALYFLKSICQKVKGENLIASDYEAIRRVNCFINYHPATASMSSSIVRLYCGHRPAVGLDKYIFHVIKNNI